MVHIDALVYSTNQGNIEVISHYIKYYFLCWKYCRFLCVLMSSSPIIYNKGIVSQQGYITDATSEFAVLAIGKKIM